MVAGGRRSTILIECGVSVGGRIKRQSTKGQLMQPDHFRDRIGFAVLAAVPATLLTSAPALAAAASNVFAASAAPIAIALGAGAFAVLAMVVLRGLSRDGHAARAAAQDQVAGLRALVDEYEQLLNGPRELTVLWAPGSSEAKVLGQPAAIGPDAGGAHNLLDFSAWLDAGDASQLAEALAKLRREGQGFERTLRTRGGKVLRGTGWLVGGGAALRLRPAFEQPVVSAAPIAAAGLAVDPAAAEAIFTVLSAPAFVRDAQNRLVFANAAYQALARSLGKPAEAAAPSELLDPVVLKRHLATLAQATKPVAMACNFGAAGSFDLIEFPISGGKAGYLRPRAAQAATPAAPLADLSHLASVMDVLATPVAVFDARRELVQFNEAYASLWQFDRAWLRPGLDERAVLDKLRTEGKLPAEPDYHAWRAKHLTAYQLTEPRELEPWHLPDGRTLKVIAAPAGPQGGVVYAFEDMTARLRLESLNRSLSNVQRETLNALSEGVAVFGTNGRLTLSNPRFSALWKLPLNELDRSPHIDQVAASCAQAMPEDGAAIWRDLKRAIIDLTPNRADISGRLTRADGRMLDYAVVRLPDGQTMMTFLDVTESANYSRVLKERNDALITADRLKDAFVQNVSYELRSPLTNIIGFADLLASEAVGPLTERQRAYTDYIRASSVTLGVLIDNILDLATVDAGIAEMRPEPQDVAALVEKARAGLAATFPEVDGESRLNLVVDLPPDLPVLVADGTRIVQVLYNLLSNAVRFSEPAGEIRLSVAARGERMVFTVEDEGAGLSDEVRASIAEGGETGRQRGAGLGLAIVRSFVNLHGGTIAIEKRNPRGNRVVVSLPRDAALAGVAE